MKKNNDMNLLQRLFYGIRWRIYTRQCTRCGGFGKSRNDPEFDCEDCGGTGIERIEEAATGVFDDDLRKAGYRVEVMPLRYFGNIKDTSS